MEVLENNKTVLVKGNVIGFEESTLEPLKYLVQFPDLTTASLSVDMIEDEPQAGHADEAPRYVKNILARLRELPLHDREVWLKAIMAEFERDFSHAKWREGYEQGKFEASLEIDKMCPVVHQFVADWYEKHKNSLEFNIFDYVYRFDQNEESDLKDWFDDIDTNAFQTLVNMHQFGYEIEKEAKYTVKVKATKQYLCNDELGPHFSPSFRSNFTKTNLEELGFGWVFDCKGIEVEEV
nr:MAG TPA: Protein of unknown function (DUF1642) [Caudoviricetes sp.]